MATDGWEVIRCFLSIFFRNHLRKIYTIFAWYYTNVSMDDFGDYIYLILLVIASLGGLLKKSKRAKDAQKQVTSSKTWEERMRDLEKSVQANDEISDDISEEEVVIEIKEERNEPEIIINPKVKTEPAFVTYQADVQEKAVVHTESNTDDVVEPTVDTKDSNSWTISNPEEARRAFVYAEIFNRKY